MKANNFSMRAYLERIGLACEPDATIDGISVMMQHQLFSVPFENLDVQAGMCISLVPESIFDKIVAKRRGGYCYEVNGLFAMALDVVGLSYRFIAARPMFYPVRRPKTHMAIVLETGGDLWLCDLGFGSHGLRLPLSLELLDVEVHQDCDTFKLTRSPDGEYLLSAKIDYQWLPQYAFNLSAQEWIDFAPANYLNSTHPDAIFVQKLIVIIQTSTGRKCLVGDTLKTTHSGVSDERIVPAADRVRVLSSEFGLHLGG